MYTVVRLRSTVNTRPEIRDTLKMLRLNKVNHCVVLNENPQNKGMILKVKDYVAWGNITPEALAQLMHKRGELKGGARLTNEYVKENTSFNDIDALAQAIHAGDVSVKDVPQLKPLFRLHPPRKGHRGIKKSVAEGGVLGYHGDDINTLLHKMR
ncbi:MAG: 50S ribosomal protein L30 [Methanosarcinales archaeon]|nr:50S ribosomal protein L30 [ANME-2 cluster archaeon]MDF1531703.1 50S ribosomal protein L30 [ANME-2 cluster archaeon]MDW7775321.1 50S ribosomal protein L30 [Methanosarcinales archaeon]